MAPFGSRWREEGGSQIHSNQSVPEDPRGVHAWGEGGDRQSFPILGVISLDREKTSPEFYSFSLFIISDFQIKFSPNFICVKIHKIFTNKMLSQFYSFEKKI